MTTRYATPQDMQVRFGATEMENLDDDAATRVTAALTDASADIDGFIGQRFTLPLPGSDWPLLRSLACRIARARLYDNSAPDTVMEDWRSARAALKRLAAGETRLLDADGAEAPSRRLGSRAGPDPVMTAEALEGL